MNLATKDMFDDIYEIMEEAFPVLELRERDMQEKLMDNEKYHMYVKRNDENRIVAFMAIWKFENFAFLEHIAVDKSMRGMKIGEKMLSEFLSEYDKPFFLEVDPPEDDLSVRRVGFYTRLGFVLNNFEYFQLPLRKSNPMIPLKIMSYKNTITQQEFKPYQYVINTEAYGAVE